MSGQREIVFDTETTGFDARGDDRITEIGALELIDLMPTGKTYHTYVDPQRNIPEKVTEITGLTREFLTGKPLFADVAEDFLGFIGDSPVIAHNADFDRGFINAELERAGFDAVEKPRFVDTLKIARRLFPGSPASLDALCKRFDISLASRSQHGALIDAQLLARVYLELRGGRARKLDLDNKDISKGGEKSKKVAPTRPEKLPVLSSVKERADHQSFIEKLGGDNKTMLWQYYWQKAKRNPA